MLLLALAGPAGLSRTLCSVAVFDATWPTTVSDISRENPGMERSGPALTAFGGSGTGRAATTAAEGLC